MPTGTIFGAAGGGRARYAAMLALLLGVILALRVLMLGFAGTDLFFDEAQYWSWSTDPAFGYYSKPPLIAWLISISTGVCGLSEFCIRLPSPLIHTGTAVLIFLLGSRLYNPQTGFWAALVFATLPGVSLSSGIISTDVPLLFCWALALYAFAAMLEDKRWWPALLLGAALGLGLNAKYAMVYFILCAGVYLAVTPAQQRLLRDPRLYLALGISAAMLVPNIIWNLEHGFATISHTADNAKWGGPLFHPLKALEFFGAQFGVFGPILFAGLLVIVWRAWRRGVPDADRMLLSFSLPVVVLVLAQALLSRAHANWAAVSYVAATVLVTATMIRDVDWRWLKASLALHILVAVAIGVGIWQAGRFSLPGNIDPFARTLGWKGLAASISVTLRRARQAGRPYGGIVTDDRSLSAELIYYLRNDPTPLRAWLAAGTNPRDHFQLTRPFKGAIGEPVLLVSRTLRAKSIIAQFARSELIAERFMPTSRGEPRRITLYRLSGFKAPAR